MDVASFLKCLIPMGSILKLKKRNPPAVGLVWGIAVITSFSPLRGRPHLPGIPLEA
jgi:hypothetical protein